MLKLDEGVGTLENGRISFAYFEKWKTVEFACLLFSILTILLSVLEYELEFRNESPHIQKVLLWIIFLCTIILITMIILRFNVVILFQRSRNMIGAYEGLRSTGLFKYMILEILLSIPHPNPFLDEIRFTMSDQVLGKEYYHSVNEMLNLLQIVRVFLILRVFFIISPFFSTSAHRICDMYDAKTSYFFVIKARMQSAPLSFIFTNLCLSLFILAYALRICERPLSRIYSDWSYDNYLNALWNVVEVMATVGYGEYTARTILGRGLTIIIGIWGVGTLSLLVVSLSNLLAMEKLELKAYTVIERLRLKSLLREWGSKSIIQAVHLWKKSSKGNKVSYNDVLDLRKSTNEFRLLNRQYKSLTLEGSTLTEEMMTGFDKIREEMKELKKRQTKLSWLTQTMVDMAETIEKEGCISNSMLDENAEGRNAPLEFKLDNYEGYWVDLMEV
eukprot:TRINITY_DN166_c0_g1_i5.p1 TRINITY_DN166_c0_g1~~TRINITY_DN166_c0_g1_i5.p1  ORF type:complete len:445 (+),score=33.44 TRINITY_DN166_c0_g1_i5:243-1577(+)